MELGLSGKRVLITGASQGIGESCAIDFAKEGALVSIVARREDALKKISDALGGQKSGHYFYACDLMEQGTPTAAVEALVGKHGPIDIVVHNLGGTLGVKNPLSPMEDWFKVLQYNVGHAMEINNLVIPPMQKKKWGRVIHVSSISAENLRGSAPYGCAKAFVNAYVKTLGRAVAPDGVVVSGVMPGAIMAEGGHWDNIRKNNPNMMADFLRHHHAIGRLGGAEEISPFIVFMASKWVTFAPTSLIPIDGGTM